MLKKKEKKKIREEEYKLKIFSVIRLKDGTMEVSEIKGKKKKQEKEKQKTRKSYDYIN